MSNELDQDQNRQVPIWIQTVCIGYQQKIKLLQQEKLRINKSNMGSSVLDQAMELIKLFSCSTQLSTKFILLINVKMPTMVGILTFISMINTTSERLKGRYFFICPGELKFQAQLS